MLDEYWFGEVNRISPEAPVPIVKIAKSDERPGGAANVARNIVAFGAQATLLSVVGPDTTASRLRAVLDLNNIRHELQVDPEIRTTCKLRIIGHQQQMLRVDFEDVPSEDVLNSKKTAFERLLKDADIVIFSDYLKGALSHIEELIELVRKAGKKIFIDPKGADYQRYAGATVITPNRGELAQAVGAWSTPEVMDERAKKLRTELGLEALLVTMSEHGMKMFLADEIIDRPAQAQEVFDVSGAGDTVIAAIAVMVGTGSSWEEAVEFANTAAGVVVSKLGTSVATIDEVEPLLKQVVVH